MKPNITLQKTSEKILIGAEHHLTYFTQLDMAEYLTGQRKRVKSVEYHLPRLVADGKLVSCKYGRKHIYAFKSKQGIQFNHIRHDLICTQLMLKFQKQCHVEVVSERLFREARSWFYIIPDWAILLSKTVILCEFSTHDNFSRTSLMKKKLTHYRTHLHKFESYFETDIIVLFIFEIPQFEIKQFVKANLNQTETFFYFTNLKTFLGTDSQALLSTPIYLWGGDGNIYPLSNNDK